MPHERFAFIPMGAQAPKMAISCDGLVRGAALDLSHWRQNRTPPDWKADTSTEIALNFSASDEARSWRLAPVVNNHFDTDGVLAAYAILDPNGAHARSDLIIAAAEVGDFQEWPKDPRGIKIDAAIVQLGDQAGSEEAAYREILPMVPRLLDHIDEFSDLWRPTWQRIEESMRLVNSGRVRTSRIEAIGIVVHEKDVQEIPGPTIARLLAKKASRYIIAFEHDEGQVSLRYELPRYAWADTIDRPQLENPDVPRLLAALGVGFRASPDTPGGTAVIETEGPMQVEIDAVIATLLREDPVAAIRR